MMNKCRLMILVMLILFAFEAHGQVDSVVTLKDRVAEILPALWSEYSAECYNDSTVSMTQVPCPEGKVGCVVAHWGEVIKHREPTMDGFISYLKRRK